VVNLSGPAPSVLEGYLTEAELARQLNCSVRTLQRLAEKGEGPPRTRFGRFIYYHYQHVREWLLDQEQRRKPVGSAHHHARRQLRRG
jgi:excisionase family DNA binding protein